MFTFLENEHEMIVDLELSYFPYCHLICHLRDISYIPQYVILCPLQDRHTIHIIAMMGCVNNYYPLFDLDGHDYIIIPHNIHII